jgi:hypothetical protein
VSPVAAAWMTHVSERRERDRLEIGTHVKVHEQLRWRIHFGAAASQAE